MNASDYYYYSFCFCINFLQFYVNAGRLFLVGYLQTCIEYNKTILSNHGLINNLLYKFNFGCRKDQSVQDK
jgi:hypothetical protein